jgi:hypothetical protein
MNMAFLNRVKDNIVEFLRPGTVQESGELKALRQLYDNPAQGSLLPNKWYQIVSAASGKLLGYSYVCLDSQEHQLVHPNEWARDYECPQCHARFNLYKQTGICDAEGTFKVPASEIEKVLSKLPVRPRLDGGRTPSIIDTWSGDDGNKWQGNAPLGSDGGWI